MKRLVEHPASSMPSASRPQSWLRNRKQALSTLLLALSAAVRFVDAQNPKDNFCRRYAHQTTVIDDKLYIDGGWVNFDGFQQDHKDYPNTWLGYHDLNKLVLKGGNLWPDLNIGLSKNSSIPTVHGGVLWGDQVNKRFYLYGGESTAGVAKDPFHLLSYDILNNKWDDFGAPKTALPPNITSFGAGVGVSQTGMGYYYGGWISNASMNGWNQPRTMSSNFYSYSYDSGSWAQPATIDNNPRAEGSMVWIPAGDTRGLLVYMGGVIGSQNGSDFSPQPLNEIFVFDAQGNSWSSQTATGEIPQNRRQFCTDVAWAPDKSSFNIYLWGGLSVPPPVVNTTSFNDVYILTLPSFIWVKAYPDHHGNATLDRPYDHYSASCNMVKSMSQLFVIGGTYTDTDACDLEYDAWAQHDFWTGTNKNAGDNQTYWAPYDPNVTSNVVPVDVYSVVGGNKYGGATLVGPKSGFDTGNKPLQDLLGRRPSIQQRTPTRNVPGPTGSSNSHAVQGGSSALSAGAIAGIVIGSLAGVAVVLFFWIRIGRRVVQRREERRQSQMTQTTSSYARVSNWSKATALSPHTPVGPWEMESPHLVGSPPPADQHGPAPAYGSIAAISELPEQTVDDRLPASPEHSRGLSPGHSPGLPPAHSPGPGP